MPPVAPSLTRAPQASANHGATREETVTAP